jgi:hypothetical protein
MYLLANNMDFTFGIITYKNSESYIKKIIESIEIQNISNYEIIIVGEANITGRNISIIPFDETLRNGWVTCKKNLICKEAKYENIVVMHDYICLDKNWYKGFLDFGNNFEYCITRINNMDGKRYRDYTIYPGGIEPYFQENCLLPYNYNPSNNIKKLLYLSGAYYIIKKHIALEHPLNEILTWGDGEDVEYSQRLATNNIHIVCNSNSTVYLLKDKYPCHWEKELSSEQILQLESLSDDILFNLFKNQKKQYQDWIHISKHIYISHY